MALNNFGQNPHRELDPLHFKGKWRGSLLGDEEMSGRWREKILILYYTIYYSTVIEVRPHCSKTVKEFTTGNPSNACFMCLDAKIYQHMAYGKASAYALSSYEILYKIEKMVL